MSLNLSPSIAIGSVTIGDGHPLAFIAGPCVIESPEHALFMARSLRDAAESLNVPFIFKASFDKANRTSIASYRGPGIEQGLEILARVKAELGVPVLTDVHEPDQCELVAEVADCLQIPAFLCRQTDLVVAAARTGKAVNVKKGQFLAPWDMKNVLVKIAEAGGRQASLTERGSSFGYNRLVVDMTGLIEMRAMGVPVIFDATHSVQLPGGQGTATGGNRGYVAPLSRAAAAVGIDALFLEVHDRPDQAKSDGPNSLRLEDFGAVVREVTAIARTVAPSPVGRN